MTNKPFLHWPHACLLILDSLCHLCLLLSQLYFYTAEVQRDTILSYLCLSASYSTSVLLIRMLSWGTEVPTTLHCISFPCQPKSKDTSLDTSLNVAIKSEVHKWEASFSNTVTRWLRNGENDSVIKSNDCSSRGRGFKSQQPHGSSQLSTMPVPGNPTSSSGLRTRTCMVHRHTCRLNTHNSEIKNNHEEQGDMCTGADCPVSSSPDKE